jgi:hypothetical protein
MLASRGCVISVLMGTGRSMSCAASYPLGAA